MNRDNVFAAIRTMAKTLTQIQVDGINAILDSCVKHDITDRRHIAYALATAYHEARFKPIEEIGKGAGKSYGKIDAITHKAYYGRGFVQLTWKGNYILFGHILNIDLVNRPELAMQIDVAAEIITIGMKQGSFTGVGLSKYFNDKVTQPISARKIINGTDKAELIAGYYEIILKGLS